MAKVGLAQGLASGLQFGLQLGMKAKQNREANELNKAKIIQTNNKVLSDANKAFNDTMNQYNTRRENLLEQLNGTTNETQRNSISKAISSLDSQWGSTVNTAAQSGVKMAGDIASKFQPYQHDDLHRITIGGKDFTVPTAVFEDYRINPKNYNVTSDGRGLTNKATVPSRPLAGAEVTYTDENQLVDGAVRSDSMFKPDHKGQIGGELTFVNDMMSKGWTRERATEAYKSYGKKGSSGVSGTDRPKTNDNLKNITWLKSLGEDITPVLQEELDSRIANQGIKQTGVGEQNIKNINKKSFSNIGAIRKYKESGKGFDTSKLSADINFEDRSEMQTNAIRSTQGKELKPVYKKFTEDSIALKTTGELVKKVSNLISSGKIERNAVVGIAEGVKKYINAAQTEKEAIYTGLISELEGTKLEIANALISGVKSDADMDRLDKIVSTSGAVQGAYMKTQLESVYKTMFNSSDARANKLISAGYVGDVVDSINDSKKTYDDISSGSAKVASYEKAKKVKPSLTKEQYEKYVDKKTKRKFDTKTDSAEKKKHKAGDKVMQKGITYEYDGENWNKAN